MKTLGCILGLLLTVAPSFALTIGGSDSKAVPDGTTITLNLPKFNGPLSNLTNVWLKLKFDISNAVVEMDNDSIASATGTAKVASTFTNLTSTAGLLKSNFDSINASDFTIASNQSFSMTGTSGDNVGGFNVTTSGDYVYCNFGTITKQDSGDIFNGLWSSFVGSGDFQITLLANYLTGATFTGGDGYFQGSTPNGQIFGEVVYSYIPEPATVIILALGALLSAKRNSKKA
jgi:hypothetical protein